METPASAMHNSIVHGESRMDRPSDDYSSGFNDSLIGGTGTVAPDCLSVRNGKTIDIAPLV